MVSNDNTRPTADVFFPFGVWVGVAGVLDVVCEPVVGGALVVVAWFVAFASVGAGEDVAELSGVGAGEPAVVVGLFCTEFVVGAVAGEDGVVRTLVGFAGLIGLTGEATFVGLVTDF
jgi:hypothetical protein